MLAWLGAAPSAIEKYKQLYSDEEYDFMEYYPALQDFLWPRHGLSSASNTLCNLEAILEKRKYSGVVIHAFSIGCYYYSLMLYHMRTSKKKYVRIQSLICAQVLDSPVIGTTSEMASGVAKMMTRRPVAKAIVKSLCMLYMVLTKSHTVHYYDILYAEIKFRSLAVPSLLLTSYGDPMIVVEVIYNTVHFMKHNYLEIVCLTHKNSLHWYSYGQGRPVNWSLALPKIHSNLTKIDCHLVKKLHWE